MTNDQMLISDSWIDAFVDGTDEITISYKHNCGDLVTLNPSLSDINADNQYVLDIMEGVYYVTLTNTTDQNNIQTQNLCVVYLTEDTKCKVTEVIAEDYDLKIASYYTALNLVNSCTECKCDKACTIYDEFIKLIDNGNCNCE